MNLENKPNVGNHLPVLIKIVQMTSGPILELGMGTFSTNFLHWACFPSRKLVSYDNSPEILNYFKRFKSDYHEIGPVDDWNKIDITGHWNIVLVDHAPGERRKEEIKRLSNSADYIIVHDTEWDRKRIYGFPEIFPLFKYRYDYTASRHPFTTVLSNFKDLSDFPNIFNQPKT